MTTDTTVEKDLDEEFGDLDFTKAGGADTAEARMRAQANKRGGKKFDTIPYLKFEDSLKGGKPVYFRPVNDSRRDPSVPIDPHHPIDCMTVLVHPRVKSKTRVVEGEDGKKETKGGYDLTAMCRTDPLIAHRFPEGCYVCQNVKETEGKHKGKPVLPRESTFGIFILREPIFGTKAMVEAGDITERQVGRVVYCKDMLRKEKVLDEEGKETGETLMVPEYRLVNLSWKTFWSKLFAIGDNNGTIVDRDFKGTRVGSGMSDTDYKISPLDPFEIKDPDDPDKKIILDLGNPRIIAHRYGGSLPDLRKYVLRMASADYYNFNFIPQEGDEAPADGSDAGDDDAPSDAIKLIRERSARPMDEEPAADKPADDADEDLAALTERARNMGGTQDEAPDSEPVQQQPAEAKKTRSSLLD